MMARMEGIAGARLPDALVIRVSESASRRAKLDKEASERRERCSLGLLFAGCNHTGWPFQLALVRKFLLMLSLELPHQPIGSTVVLHCILAAVQLKLDKDQ